ncbi:hypothetical protein GGX14DRAFT_645961 [Mycena pura]|uniref:Uncharacterized protein n=1 Tax=Mycena pura TaxID=153505 RepID=A0AAD6Y849_9AGAR|nr:hypothetical protein GGX14DRAFT_645961 [Mycena pura]
MILNLHLNVRSRRASISLAAESLIVEPVEIVRQKLFFGDHGASSSIDSSPSAAPAYIQRESGRAAVEDVHDTPARHEPKRPESAARCDIDGVGRAEAVDKQGTQCPASNAEGLWAGLSIEQQLCSQNLLQSRLCDAVRLVNSVWSLAKLSLAKFFLSFMTMSTAASQSQDVLYEALDEHDTAYDPQLILDFHDPTRRSGTVDFRTIVEDRRMWRAVNPNDANLL